MSKPVRVLVTVAVCLLLLGCSPGAAPTEAATDASQSSQEDQAAAPAASTCSATNPGGTIAPETAICSATFVVNGTEETLRSGENLQLSPGDQLQLIRTELLVGPYEGDGGATCVDVVPLDPDGAEISSARVGSHMMPLPSGLKSVDMPEHSWIVGEDWSSIAVAVNHWPADGTDDPACGEGQCERDDQLIITIQR
jgi:hypothetical protein